MKREDILKNPNNFIKKHQALAESHALSEKKVELLQDQVRTLANELRQLKLMIAQSLYGRKSERDIEGQLGLPFTTELEGAMAEVLETSSRVDAFEEGKKKDKRSKKKKGGRTAIPAHLRRERIVYELSHEELDELFGAGRWRVIGEEIREELDYQPSSLFVKEHVTMKYASTDRSLAPVRAEAPKAVIPKGRPGAGLLAYIITSKYNDHLPLYRLTKIFKRERLDLSRAIMCHWLKESSLLLLGIVRAIKKEILSGDIIRTDATPVAMLDPNSKGGSKKVTMWPYMSHDGQIVFDFTTDGSRDGPRSFLGDFQGYLQVDGHNVYTEFFKKGMVEVGCMAHARRKIFKTREDHPADATHGLAIIKELYQIEEKAREEKLNAAEVFALRQKVASPRLDKLKKWAEDVQERVLPSDKLGEAVSYLLKRFKALSRYTEDGRLAIDNNDVERAIRQVALGRKNFLFFAGETGGKVAAVFYTLLANCELEKINPLEYLSDVLTRVQSTQAKNAIKLSPRNWKAAKEAEEAAAKANS